MFSRCAYIFSLLKIKTNHSVRFKRKQITSRSNISGYSIMIKEFTRPATYFGIHSILNGKLKDWTMGDVRKRTLNSIEQRLAVAQGFGFLEVWSNWWILFLLSCYFENYLRLYRSRQLLCVTHQHQGFNPERYRNESARFRTLRSFVNDANVHWGQISRIKNYYRNWTKSHFCFLLLKRYTTAKRCANNIRLG